MSSQVAQALKKHRVPDMGPGPVEKTLGCWVNMGRCEREGHWVSSCFVTLPIPTHTHIHTRTHACTHTCTAAAVAVHVETHRCLSNRLLGALCHRREQQEERRAVFVRKALHAAEVRARAEESLAFTVLGQLLGKEHRILLTQKWQEHINVKPCDERKVLSQIVNKQTKASPSKNY